MFKCTHTCTWLFVSFNRMKYEWWYIELILTLLEPFIPKGSKFRLLEEGVEPAFYYDKLWALIFANIDVLSLHLIIQEPTMNSDFALHVCLAFLDIGHRWMSCLVRRCLCHVPPLNEGTVSSEILSAFDLLDWTCRMGLASILLSFYRESVRGFTL